MTGPLNRLPRSRRAIVLLLLGAAGAAACVGGLAEGVLHHRTQGFDDWALRSLRRSEDPARPLGPAIVAPAAKAVTFLGSAVGIVGVIVLAGAVLCRRLPRGGLAAGLLVASGTGAIVCSEILKRLVDRPRPSVVPLLAQVPPHSFPSGHSMLSAAVYLTIAFLAYRAVRPSRRAGLLRACVWTAAVLLTLLVGASRVVLGVHYPTDVLAGWAGGLAWAMVCWAAWYRAAWPKRAHA